MVLFFFFARKIREGVYSCGHIGSNIFMNFINPSFPDSDSTVGSCVFKIRPARPEICQVRERDFQHFLKSLTYKYGMHEY